MKKTIIAMILTSLFLVIFTSVSLAWFVSYLSVYPRGNGSIAGDYFAGGDGTMENPYIITDKSHVYNLAWLQYLGTFNQKNEEGKIEQYYFIVDEDIDMEELVIPPIGTEANPFVGNFDGNGHAISNFTISNYVEASEDTEGNITTRPLSITTLDETASIVGFFGVIGYPNAKDSEGNDVILTPHTDGSGTIETGTAVNSVYDMTLRDFTVRTDTDTSLVGLLAGYVNGTVENVAVGGESSIVVNPDTAFMEIAEMCGLTGADAENLNKLNAISLFSLVGAAHKDVKWAELPQGSGGDGLIGVVPKPGEEGSGFGSSMDMVSLIKRLTYMYAENLGNSKNFPLTKFAPTMYGSVVAPDESLTMYLGKDSIVPLNVNTDEMLYDVTTDANGNVTREDKEESTYTVSRKTLTTNDWYKTATEESVLPENTGYIVGYDDNNSSNTAWIRVRNLLISSKTYKGIYKSLTTTAGGVTEVTRNNLELLNIGGDGVTYKIKDQIKNKTTQVYEDVTKTGSTVGNSNYSEKTPADFKRYDDVMSNFIDTMKNKTMLSGLRFDASDIRGITISNNAVTSGISEITAQLCGEPPKSNYQLINGAINFTLQDNGYITAIAGTYYYTNDNDDTKHTLFTLLQVTRDPTTNAITNVTEIKSIWVTKNDNGDITGIEYNITDADVDTFTYNGKTYTRAYKEGTLDIEHAAYYFEIPVKKGDYAIGALKEDSAGAYLMYLDIGSNGDLKFDEGGGEGGTGEDPKHVISGVNFVDGTVPSDLASHVAEHPLAVYEIKDTNSRATGFTATFVRNEDGSVTQAINNTDYTVTKYTGTASIVAFTPLPLDLPRKKEYG